MADDCEIIGDGDGDVAGDVFGAMVALEDVVFEVAFGDVVTFGDEVAFGDVVAFGDEVAFGDVVAFGYVVAFGDEGVLRAPSGGSDAPAA